MRILLASSEAVPFSKTGGLADVASALAKALAAAGHQVWLITPYYPQAIKSADAERLSIAPSGTSVRVRISSKMLQGQILRAKLPGSAVEVLLVDQKSYFDRPGLYVQNGTDFKDNCERFVFFSRAVLEAAREMNLRPDVIHANDWQTGLIPPILGAEYRGMPGFEQTASVYTIHNMAFQGRFWHWDMLLTGLDWKFFNWRQMEFYGDLNLLKTGIAFADKITTVSPTYAREIQTPEFGYGLESALGSRAADLVGILNGVDTEIWNPATDPALPQHYTHETVEAGKAACKTALQARMGLPARGDVPLFGMISRMTDQKGLDLIAECADEVLALDVQLCFLGTGEAKYEQLLRDLAQSHPDKVAVTVGFDESLAHLIEAGCDAYLMPSRFEPCGLNQMYSLLYGTVPIVHTVGGLADSVVDASPDNQASGRATGFCFSEYDAAELLRQIRRVCATYRDREAWLSIVQNGMRQDWSWRRSSEEYVRVYRAARERHAAPVASSRR